MFWNLKKWNETDMEIIELYDYDTLKGNLLEIIKFD